MIIKMSHKIECKIYTTFRSFNKNIILLKKIDWSSLEYKNLLPLAKASYKYKINTCIARIKYHH